MQILRFFEVLALIITFYYLFDISLPTGCMKGKIDIEQTLVN